MCFGVVEFLQGQIEFGQVVVYGVLLVVVVFGVFDLYVVEVSQQVYYVYVVIWQCYLFDVLFVQGVQYVWNWKVWCCLCDVIQCGDLEFYYCCLFGRIVDFQYVVCVIGVFDVGVLVVFIFQCVGFVCDVIVGGGQLFQCCWCKIRCCCIQGGGFL